MRAELKRLHRQFGMTIIYATPDELEALSMCEVIAVMRNGAVVQKGTPDELYDAPRDIYVAGKIGAPHMNLIEATVGEGAEVLETGFGSFDLARKVKARAGDKVVMGVRPADLEIASGKAADLSAPVQLLEPLGDVTIVSLGEKADNLRILLPESRASVIKLGDKLPIKVDAKKIHVFRAEDGIALR
jgi:multiple sugar transport system ATP-binding protein